MLKRSSIHKNEPKNTVPKRPAVVAIPLTNEGKNAAAVALGRLGGLKGGTMRAAKLTAKRKQEIARIAAQARWGKKRG